MKKILGCATAMMVVVASTHADARCQTADLQGRWDVYGIANTFNAFAQEDEDGFEDGIVTEVELFNHGTTLDCVIKANQRGRLSKSSCIERSQLGGFTKIPLTGDAAIKANCTIQWSLEFVDRQSCVLDGTMTIDKQMVSGVANCDGGTVSLFNMVRR